MEPLRVGVVAGSGAPATTDGEPLPQRMGMWIGGGCATFFYSQPRAAMLQKAFNGA